MKIQVLLYSFLSISWGIVGYGITIAQQSSHKAAPLPKVEELITRALNARGGLEKIKAMHNAVMIGRVTVQGALQGSCTVNVKRSNMVRVELSVQGFTLVQAFDGKTGWVVNPLLGAIDPRAANKNEAKQLAYQAEMFDGELLDYKEKGHKVQLLGRESVEILTKESIEGFTAYKIKITKKTGEIITTYIDASTLLPFKHVTRVPTSNGDAELSTFLRSYRPVNGVLIPHAIEQKMGGKPYIQMIFEKVQVNSSVSDSLFVLPTPK